MRLRPRPRADGGDGRIRLAVVASEFFDRSVGRMGGFGWAAAQVAHCFGAAPELGVDVVLVDSRGQRGGASGAERLHGTRLLSRRGGRRAYARQLRAERPDLLLLVDYRPGYERVLDALPRTPAIVWSRDPRGPQEQAQIDTLAIPGAFGVRPRGIAPIDCTGLGRAFASRLPWRRRLRIAATSPWLHARAAAAYAVPESALSTLPNPLEVPAGPFAKAAEPLVVWLGRLDPYKRPWLAVELARRLPAVRFALLGQAHFSGSGAWEPPADLPANVELHGHVDGDAKQALLGSAWLLLNTSIHEGLAVSMLEALGCETPLVAGLDPEGLVSRFGACAGRWDGDGLAGLDAFEAALRRLLADADLRRSLGAAGRAWVIERHGRPQFVAAFSALARELGRTPGGA